MKVSIPAPLLIALLYINWGCGPDSSAESQPSEKVSSNESPMKVTAVIDQVTHKGFVITVSNVGEEPMCLDTYYFGYRLTAMYVAGRKRVFDYGDDKVPIGYEADWHVLRRGQSISWSVEPPTSWDSLENASEIRYEYVLHRSPPRHICVDPRRIEVYLLLAEWSKERR